MDKDRLKEIMFDQKDVFNSKKHLISRDIGLEKYISSRQVVIVSGIRRCGKSSLLFLIKQKMNLDESEYCYFNFDDERIIADISILEKIYDIHIEVYGKEPVLFLDEIQNINEWEKFVNRMYEHGAKIFVTGSNANLLSSEISTSLTGRNKVIELFPFSFNEYLRFTGNKYNLNRISTKSKALLIKDFNYYSSNYFSKIITCSILLFFVLMPVSSFTLKMNQEIQLDRNNIQLSDDERSRFSMFERAFSISDFSEISNKGRLQIWRETLISISERPFLGVGFGNFPTVLEENISTSKMGSSAHSTYLDIASEIGVFGLIIFLLILIEILKTARNLFFKLENKYLKIFTGSFFVYFVWICAYGLFDIVIFNDKVLMMTVIMIGMLYSIYPLHNSKKM